MPSQRSRCSRPLAVVAITDQMPITAAPRPAYTSTLGVVGLAGRAGTPTVAKYSGQITWKTPSKAETASIFRCSQ